VRSFFNLHTLFYTLAEFYSKIRSCISTYKKNQVNVLQALILALNHNPIII